MSPFADLKEPIHIDQSMPTNAKYCQHALLVRRRRFKSVGYEPKNLFCKIRFPNVTWWKIGLVRCFYEGAENATLV